MTARKQRRRGHPAENSGTVAGALAALACYAFSIDDPGIFASLALVVGAIPRGITWIVERRWARGS